MNVCPYCDQRLSPYELQYHLDNCSNYHEVSNRNSTGRSRIFSALRDSLSLYRPWQQADHSDEWNSSSYSSEVSHRSTPDFSFNAEPNKVSTVTCPVCFEYFDSQALRPLILPKCGHTICAKCLRQIIKTSSIIKCPVCRKTNQSEMARVNHALLELSEATKNTQNCPVHQLEIVGFCQDDSQLLCGACVMEHNSHECFALDDPRVLEVAEKGKVRLGEEEEKLLGLQQTWTLAQKEMDSLSGAIAQLEENHVMQFKMSEKGLIESIRNGKKSCLMELQQLSLRDDIKELENNINNELGCLQQEIVKTKDKRERFEEMDIYQKLSKPKILSNSEAKKLPSLGPLYKLILKLKAEVNYKSAIYKSHISL